MVFSDFLVPSNIKPYNRAVHEFEALGGNDEVYCQPFFVKVERSNHVLFCCSTEAKFSARSLLKLVSYSKFGLSKPDFDRKMRAKDKCLKKAKEKEVFI